MKFVPYYGTEEKKRGPRVGDDKIREAQNEGTSLLSCHEVDGEKIPFGKNEASLPKNLQLEANSDQFPLLLTGLCIFLGGCIL